MDFKYEPTLIIFRRCIQVCRVAFIKSRENHTKIVFGKKNFQAVVKVIRLGELFYFLFFVIFCFVLFVFL